MDKWYKWITETRQGGKENYAAAVKQLISERNEILDKLPPLKATGRLLDLGCGDGLLGFGAINYRKFKGALIYVDISKELLDVCKEIAKYSKIDNRIEYINTDAGDLAAINDESVDYVVVRNVMMYIENRKIVMSEIRRVLKKGGIAIIRETINKFGVDRRQADEYHGYDVSSLRKYMPVVRKPAEAKNSNLRLNTMYTLTPEELIDSACDVGFKKCDLTYEAVISKGERAYTWDVLYYGAPNPKEDSLYEYIKQHTTDQEREEFERIFMDIVKHKGCTHRYARATLHVNR